MGNFCNPPEHIIARKNHRCTYCAEGIGKGFEYIYQTGVYDGHWYTSKMHIECFEDMAESGDNEYTPYCNERPRITA